MIACTPSSGSRWLCACVTRSLRIGKRKHSVFPEPVPEVTSTDCGSGSASKRQASAWCRNGLRVRGKR